MKRAMGANQTLKHDYLMASSPEGSGLAMWPLKNKL
jgi:hypothetical protein